MYRIRNETNLLLSKGMWLFLMDVLNLTKEVNRLLGKRM